MSLGYLLDSDIIIYYLKGNKYYIDLVSNLQERGGIFCSVLNKYEILSGMRKEEFETTINFLALIIHKDIDINIVEKAAEYRREYNNLKPIDTLIAATAKIHGLIIVTGNVKDYPMMDVELYKY